eukprot:TRINITY_DN2168_c0_g1_i1.p1 TRINITY_DN2168_c0_g1~~TRINITY_DN2168_c0_g1_i1.p1  ORF type:complete len:433 (+),score=90.54 TRINITY_DN2168_c0_g1_i1:100-1299(+)
MKIASPPHPEGTECIVAAPRMRVPSASLESVTAAPRMRVPSACRQLQTKQRCEEEPRFSQWPPQQREQRPPPQSQSVSFTLPTTGSGWILRTDGTDRAAAQLCLCRCTEQQQPGGASWRAERQAPLYELGGSALAGLSLVLCVPPGGTSPRGAALVRRRGAEALVLLARTGTSHHREVMWQNITHAVRPERSAADTPSAAPPAGLPPRVPSRGGPGAATQSAALLALHCGAGHVARAEAVGAPLRQAAAAAGAGAQERLGLELQRQRELPGLDAQQLQRSDLPAPLCPVPRRRRRRPRRAAQHAADPPPPQTADSQMSLATVAQQSIRWRFGGEAAGGDGGPSRRVAAPPLRPAWPPLRRDTASGLSAVAHSGCADSHEGPEASDPQDAATLRLPRLRH